MKYCSHCASELTVRIPPGDNLPRHVCDNCDTIHYSNPKIVAGCIPEWENKILLCRRAIEPRSGFWTLPAGFMENGETTQAGAARESAEEANAVMQDLSLFGIFNIPHISQVYIIFRGILKEGYATPGIESLEVKLFEEQDIPWSEIAFSVISEALALYFEDRKNKQTKVHTGDILRDGNNEIRVLRY